MVVEMTAAERDRLEAIVADRNSRKVRPFGPGGMGWATCRNALMNTLTEPNAETRYLASGLELTP